MWGSSRLQDLRKNLPLRGAEEDHQGRRHYDFGEILKTVGVRRNWDMEMGLPVH